MQCRNQCFPDVLQELLFRCITQMFVCAKTPFVRMAATTVVVLGLFSGEWSTMRFPHKARPYRLIIPRLIPLSSQKTRWSAGSRFLSSFHRIHFAFTSGTLPFGNMDALLFHTVSKLDDRFADGFLTYI